MSPLAQFSMLPDTRIALLSPTKAEAWGLVDVYVEGVSVVEQLLENLLCELTIESQWQVL